MQNAKDSFYIALRNRLTAINPQRTILLRGVVRPGILVEEAESPMSELPRNVFVLQWSSVSKNLVVGSQVVQLTCEVHYATCGSAANVGLDRGRLLSEMDYELEAALRPLSTAKVNYAQDEVTMETAVFWDLPVFGVAEAVRDELSRIATVQVWSIEEPSEA